MTSYNWVRNLFVEFEPYQRQFILREEEKLVSVASDRMLNLKHAELNLDAFWILVEYPAIAEKALRLLLQFLTFICASSDFLL